MKWLTSEQYDIQNTIKAMEIYTAYLATNLTNVTTLAEKHLVFLYKYIEIRYILCIWSGCLYEAYFSF
jgi:hypothetical protein